MLWLALIAFYAQSAPDWSARGTAALDAQRYTEAVDSFQHAVQADPKDYAAWFNLALSNSLLNRDDAAIEGYRRALELKPGLYEAQLNLGIVLVRAKRGAEAVAPLRAAVEAKPKDFRAQSSFAAALSDAKQFAEAEQAWNAALEVDPKSAAAEAGLARTLIAESKLSDAEKHLRRAAELDGSYKPEMLRLAEAYEAAGNADAAVPIYLAFPDNVAALERAGQALLGAGKATEAIDPLERAVKLSPSPANRTALAAAYIRAKRSNEAAAVLAQALQANPADYDMRMMAGRLLRDERKFPEAAAQFFQATKLKPDSVESWNELAGALVLSERYPEAVAALDRIRALGAETPAHHYFRALSLDHLHQVEPALEAYRRFLETDAGKRPDEEFKARQRARILEKEARKR